MTTRTETAGKVRRGVGESVPRPDSIPKVTGSFAYASDLYAQDMLWGAARRGPLAHARVTHLDVGPALAMSGVQAVLTYDDLPAKRFQGQIVADQPVLADGTIRYWGEVVAIVAADDPTTAAQAAQAIDVAYEPLDPLTDVDEALARDEVLRKAVSYRGDRGVHGEVVVEATYETATQDQAPLGNEAGIAVPDGAGGVDVYGPTQWTHVDHEQIVECLGLQPAEVRVHPTGLGGAFGAREDLSLQTHLCLLALRTGRPVRMVFGREESFAAHVKRHSARMYYRHEADRAGNLVRVDAKLLLDGGAYSMTSPAVIANAVGFAVGPYRCPNVFVDGFALRTNNPPAGAMRGFGAVQVGFAVESQMDRLAEELGMDPLEFRLRNAIGPGDVLSTTGQLITEPLPTREVIESVRAMPLPDEAISIDPRELPGGTGLTTPASAVVRGVGYAVGFKNLAFSEGFDDYAEARVTLTPVGLDIHTAAIEVGQGMVTVLEQIARSVTGIEDVRVVFADTSKIGSAGSTSASRQTQMSGGAVLKAAEQLRSELLEHFDADGLSRDGIWRGDRLVATLPEACLAGDFSAHVRHRHRGSDEPDENGQGNLHVDFAVSAHRAVVDVDPVLGLVRVVKIDTAQDVGFALNPMSVIGQIEGGTMQGIGLAIMEELIVDRGIVRNPNFTDYLLPTFLDAPPVEAVLIEQPSSWGPFGAKGFAELPTISSTPAVVAAIRDATGKALTRVPVRPEDIAL
ncbi:MAG TPA: molybdopterin cofactor-binding domain-containing protein [Acidimicrobiia bacterium]|nr:molybdopterin cofactor-binding domain-containing protein [Acidimicrobiia bacterium]